MVTEDIMKQRGMSLIQLSFTLLIVALTAQFASPVYNTLIEQQRRLGMAEQLAGSLRNARTEALVRHQYVIVQAQEQDWSRGWKTILDLSGRAISIRTIRCWPRGKVAFRYRLPVIRPLRATSGSTRWVNLC